MLTNPARLGRVRARAAATRTDSILMFLCGSALLQNRLNCVERSEEDGGHSNDYRKVTVPRKHYIQFTNIFCFMLMYV